MKFRELVLCGGGTKYLAILGALQYLDVENHLDQVENYVGTSIGAVLCFLLHISYSPKDIFTLSKLYDFSALNDINADQILSFFDNLGLSTNERMIRIINIFMKHKKIPTDITFSQLYRLTKKKINIVAWCINDHHSVCFNYQNHPNMCVLIALQMAIAVPLLFRPVLYENKMYVDGGVTDNLPNCYSSHSDSSLYICLRSEIPYTQLPVDFITYVSVVYESVFSHITELKLESIREKYGECRVLQINIPSSPIIDYEMTLQKKNMLFNLGYEKCVSFMQEVFPSTGPIPQLLPRIEEEQKKCNP
jgi:predicted acylesterase/phospholipase RssA